MTPTRHQRGANANRHGANANRDGADASRSGAKVNRRGAKSNRRGTKANRSGTTANRNGAKAKPTRRQSEPMRNQREPHRSQREPTRRQSEPKRNQSEPKRSDFRLRDLCLLGALTCGMLRTSIGRCPPHRSPWLGRRAATGSLDPPMLGAALATILSIFDISPFRPFGAPLATDYGPKGLQNRARNGDKKMRKGLEVLLHLKYFFWGRKSFSRLLKMIKYTFEAFSFD